MSAPLRSDQLCCETDQRRFGRNDVTLTVVSNSGSTYAPYHLTVFAPARHLHLSDEDVDRAYNCGNDPAGCNPNATLGYVSFIHYQTKNQFGIVLSINPLGPADPPNASLPINENWTSSHLTPSPTGEPANNWPVDGQCGNGECGPQFPVEWEDEIAAASADTADVTRTRSSIDWQRMYTTGRCTP